MNRTAEFCENRATEEQIAAHLALCDARFVPPLSSRLQIREYAHKICTHGMRFEAWEEGSLVALVAMYCNRVDQGLAYITNVSVLEEWLGEHVASHLLERAVHYLKERKFEDVELEVDERNHKAIRLYERHGFVETATNEQSLVMRLRLKRRPE